MQGACSYLLWGVTGMFRAERAGGGARAKAPRSHRAGVGCLHRYHPSPAQVSTGAALVRAEGLLSLWKGLSPAVARGFVYGGGGRSIGWLPSERFDAHLPIPLHLLAYISSIVCA